jgi:branched-chain amino acid transport system permease protein
LTARRSWGWLLPLGCGVVLALLAPVLPPYAQDLIMRLMIYAVFALSLELLVGTTGLVSFGHAAFLGIGAYLVVLASPESGPASIAWLLPLSMVAAALYALAVGALSLRTRGIYFIMVTLAFAQMAYFVFHDSKVGGGSDGIYLYVRPVLALGSSVLLDLEERRQLFWFVLGALACTYAGLALLKRSRWGHALVGIRDNEQRMRAAGFKTFNYKLSAFVLAGALAGLAGFLLAVKDGIVNPEFLSWHMSAEVLLMIILGGLGSLRGAVIGTVAFTLLKEFFQTPDLVSGVLADHWQLTLGIAIIALVAWLPRGLIGLEQRLWPRKVA